MISAGDRADLSAALAGASHQPQAEAGAGRRCEKIICRKERRLPVVVTSTFGRPSAQVASCTKFSPLQCIGISTSGIELLDLGDEPPSGNPPAPGPRWKPPTMAWNFLDAGDFPAPAFTELTMPTWPQELITTRPKILDVEAGRVLVDVLVRHDLAFHLGWQIVGRHCSPRAVLDAELDPGSAAGCARCSAA